MSGKKKTTFAKLARERRLRERRLDKQARKEARKQAGGIESAEPPEILDDDDRDAGEDRDTDAEHSVVGSSAASADG